MSALLSLQKAFLPPGGIVVTVGADLAGRSLDVWSRERGLRRIDWLTLDGTADGALPALEGAAELLRLRRVEFIAFDDAESRGRLASLHALLTGWGYAMFRFADRNLEHQKQAVWDGRPCLRLAVAPRHWKRLFTTERSMFRHADLFARHNVAPRGVIHVGAHEGEEHHSYVEAGCPRVAFIEADPDTFGRLAARFTETPDVVCINRAVSDRMGRAEFTRMNASQSSSLLRPARHLDLYPHIVPEGTITVETAPLPDVLAAHRLDPTGYNLLAIDAQGAESRILAGCGALLSGFDAVLTEVNWAELYEGCGLIEEVDDILFAAGFDRVEEISPHHYSWGDAFYRRRG